MAKQNQAGLMKLFKKHFKKSEDDMGDYDEDIGAAMKPMSEMKSKHRSKRKNPMDTDEEYEEAPDMYEDDMGLDDDVYDQLEGDDADYGDDYEDDEEEDDNDGEYGDDDEQSGEEEDGLLPRLPKHQRKNIAISVITKKMSKPKRKDM